VNTLIMYPHGLGDLILLTPALRALYEQAGPVSIAILRRFTSSRLLDRCPYIDRTFYLPDPWNDYRVSPDWAAVMQIGKEIADVHGLMPCPIVHPSRSNKIAYNMKTLGLGREPGPLEVFISDQDRARAESIVTGMFNRRAFGFTQKTTGVPGLTTVAQIKDLPRGYARDFFLQSGIEDMIEIHGNIPYDEYPITVQFAMMSLASSVVLPDSVFFHAAVALGTRVDVAYFPLGAEFYETVRSTYANNVNIVHSL
jgi:hypothetical protein